MVGRFVATSGEKRWPPVGKFVAVAGENLMAIDTPGKHQTSDSDTHSPPAQPPATGYTRGPARPRSAVVALLPSSG